MSLWLFIERDLDPFCFFFSTAGCADSWMISATRSFFPAFLSGAAVGAAFSFFSAFLLAADALAEEEELISTVGLCVVQMLRCDFSARTSGFVLVFLLFPVFVWCGGLFVCGLLSGCCAAVFSTFLLRMRAGQRTGV